MKEPVNLAEAMSRIAEYWSPRVVAAVNDYRIKVVKIQGDFVWHSHDDTDELFLVLEGRMGIEFRDRTVTLNAGELHVVPRGVEHKPFADEECHVLLMEPAGVVNTGDAGGELTADVDRPLEQ
jgi:mannose-6-phosphate isomerase-like protein (cupin superfamily)